MSHETVIVLAQVPVLPAHLATVKALAATTLVPTLAEHGCEAFYQMAKQDDPNTLVFFEVFASRKAFDAHMDASYTKAFFAGLQGKLAGQPISTILQAL